MTAPLNFSPLERRALVTLISLIRDREPYREFWTTTDVPLRTLYDAMYIPGERSYELERRNQRQATRRALGRLQRDGQICALALAWVNVEDWEVIRFQGGGSRRFEKWDQPVTNSVTGYVHTGAKMDTPRWKLVGLTLSGVINAEALAAEADS